MSDKNLVACEEDHEMKTVLKHFKKRETNANVERLRGHCKSHKKDDSYKPHNRDSFYRYINEKNVLAGLE